MSDERNITVDDFRVTKPVSSISYMQTVTPLGHSVELENKTQGLMRRFIFDEAEIGTR